MGTETKVQQITGNQYSVSSVRGNRERWRLMNWSTFAQSTEGRNTGLQPKSIVIMGPDSQVFKFKKS